MQNVIEMIERESHTEMQEFFTADSDVFARLPPIAELLNDKVVFWNRHMFIAFIERLLAVDGWRNYLAPVKQRVISVACMTPSLTIIKAMVRRLSTVPTLENFRQFIRNGGFCPHESTEIIDLFLEFHGDSVEEIIYEIMDGDYQDGDEGSATRLSHVLHLMNVDHQNVIEEFFSCSGEGYIRCVEMFLDAGVDITRKCNGNTILHGVRDVDVLQLLLSRGAGVLLNKHSRICGSPLSHAIHSSTNLALIQAFVDAGAIVTEDEMRRINPHGYHRDEIIAILEKARATQRE